MKITITIEATTKMQVITLIGMFVKRLMRSNDPDEITAQIKREYGVLTIDLQDDNE